MDILEASSISLFSGVTPNAPSGYEMSYALPSLSVRSPEDMWKRAKSCLDSLRVRVEYFRLRFGNLDLWELCRARYNQISQKLQADEINWSSYSHGAADA